MFENKKKFPLWAYPDTLEKVEEHYREDNCRSQSEFIEKAVNFYIGYLTSEDKKGYLPSVVTSTLKSIVAESDNRQNRQVRTSIRCRWNGCGANASRKSSGSTAASPLRML